MEKKQFWKSKKFWAVVAIVLALVVIIVVVTLRKQAQKDVDTAEKVYQVSVMEAGETGSDVCLTYTGLVQPAEVISCTFETIGTVEKVYVQKGDAVRAGDLLVSIDPEDAMDQLDNANRQLDYAKKNLDRSQEGYDDAVADYAKACSASREKEDLDDAIKRRDEQQVKVDELKTQLEATSQYKPGSGAAAMPEVNTEYYSLQLQYESAQNTLELYKQNVDSAQEAYDKKVKEGAESNEAKAQKDRLDAAEEALDTAEEAYDNAVDAVDAAQRGVEKCTLRAEKDGYVVNVSATEGSVSTPIAPAVVLASNDVVVNFGVSQTDITILSAGMPVNVTVDDQDFSGSIKDIDVLPDQDSRTYSTNVTIDAANPDLYLGELATVKINIGERRGVWLPISIILNDGKDYIYVVEDDRAKRKYITIEEVMDDYVLVEGTKAGDKIITEGMKLVRTGSAVSYQ